MNASKSILTTALASLALTFPAYGLGLALNVNSNADLPDAGPLGDGLVDADLSTPGDQITLRGAIQEANATPGADEIVLPAGKYKLKIKGTFEDFAATGDLDIQDDLTITGAGAEDTIIDAKKARDRVIEVHGVALNLFGVTLRKGVCKKGDDRGAGLHAHDFATVNIDHCIITKNKVKTNEDGGGVSMQDSSGTITDTLISHNEAFDDGGGIDLSDGTVRLERVTVYKNKAGRQGGGVEGSDANLEFVNCTFAENQGKRGGACGFENGGTYVLTNCTIAKNKAKQGSGISEDLKDSFNETIIVQNTILANDKQTNFAGDGLTSLGHNIDSGKTCGFNATGDMEKTNPRLGKMKDNGGPTPTLSLKSDSPAIDAGDDGAAPSTDQRGMPRQDVPGVGSTMSDIGAFERQ